MCRTRFSIHPEFTVGYAFTSDSHRLWGQKHMATRNPMATTFLLICGALVASVAGADELKVSQYSGPTECDDAEKVIAGKQLGMHYTGTIDQTSETISSPCSRCCSRCSLGTCCCCSHSKSSLIARSSCSTFLSLAKRRSSFNCPDGMPWPEKSAAGTRTIKRL
jgi:hypothetical protein